MSYFNLEYIGKLISRTAMKEIKDKINYIVDICKKNNCTEENPLTFNDLDNDVFYLKVAKDRDAVVLSDENDSFILIVDNSDSYIRCKAFKLYNTFSFKDNTEKEDYKNIIKYADVYLGYSDNFDNNEYVERPNIEFFKNNDLMYSDKVFNFSPILDEVYLLKEDMTKYELIRDIHKNNNMEGNVDKIIELYTSPSYSEREKVEKLCNQILPNNYVNTINNVSLVESLIFDLESSLEALFRKFPEDN